MPLPDYISWTGHGSSCGEPPAQFSGATMHLFGITASTTALQALADRFLNAVSKPTVRYEALVGNALLTLVDIEKGTSAVEAVGWLPGRECALWIPLLETTIQAAFPPVKTRLVMWSPYIFISYAIGMATGREVWGWSKSLARIDMPAPASIVPDFSVTTVLFRELDATKQGVEDVLLSVTGTGALSTASQWNSLQQAATHIIGQLVGGLLPIGAANPFPITGEFPAIALKQFRDCASPQLACYQAVVNSPVQITHFGGGGFHAASFHATFTTAASHPIAEGFLGLPKPAGPATTVPVDWAAWVKFDFGALPGTVIAQRT